jgi:hypothetical protein
MVFFMILAEEFILPSLFSGSFFATNLTLDAQTKLAYLDFLLLLEADIRRAYFGLLSLVFCDESLAFNAKTPNLNFFFYTDHQDFMTILIHHSPELIRAVDNFCQAHNINFAAILDVATFYDGFADNLVVVLSEFLEYLWLGILFA